MPRHLALWTATLLAVVLAAQVWAQRAESQRGSYWMGVDPVDGGDSRRSLTLQANRTYALAGRDSVLTLCDGTDRGYASFTTARSSAAR